MKRRTKASLKVENDRLRDALRQIATEKTLVTSSDGTWEDFVCDFRARDRANRVLREAA